MDDISQSKPESEIEILRTQIEKLKAENQALNSQKQDLLSEHALLKERLEKAKPPAKIGVDYLAKRITPSAEFEHN